MNTEPNQPAPKFKAPALVKGLEILELLAREGRPFTLSGISDKLERSRSEIFRMVQDLETLGYIRRSSSDEGYEITNKLFTLGLEQPRLTTLLEAALPEMRSYAADAAQSCHIAIPFDGEIVVIARIESPAATSFAVRVGHRRAMHRGISGIVLYAHQPQDVQKEWRLLIQRSAEPFNPKEFDERVRRAGRDGSLVEPSNFVAGVTDIGAPIMRGGRAIAALTSPCITMLTGQGEDDVPVDRIKEAARRISDELAPA